MISLKINGKEYKNIATVDPFVEYDYYYSVKTMDGKLHREIKGKRTNYTIMFFNQNFEEYDNLKSLLKQGEIIHLEIPENSSKSVVGDYYPILNGDNLKGILWNGIPYHTAMTVTFEKVGYDE